MSDDSTKVRQINVYNNAAPEKTQTVATPQKPEKKGNGKFFTGVLVGGIPGILIGATGGYAGKDAIDEAIDSLKSDEEAKEVEINNPDIDNKEEEISISEEQPNSNLVDDDSDAVIYESAPVSHDVNDSMSFGEAFAAARAEVGAGGVFTWHGNIYSTYTQEEWADMDSSERAEYADSVNEAGMHPVPYHHTGPDPDPQPVPVPEPDPEIEILGVEHGTFDGVHQATIGHVVVDGEYQQLIDVDGEDDTFDILVADHNNDGEIDDNEIHDISEAGISVSGFEQMAQAQLEDDKGHIDEYYAQSDDLPDYTNDADPGLLA